MGESVQQGTTHTIGNMRVSTMIAEGATPLHMAVYRSRVSVIRILLAAGPRADQGDSTGSTALHWAAFYADEEATALLLQSPTVAITHFSPNSKFVEQLIAAEADMALTDAAGSTPLDLAVSPTAGTQGMMMARDWFSEHRIPRSDRALEALMQHSTVQALVAALAKAHSSTALTAADKQQVTYKLARKATNLDADATATAALARNDADLMHVFFRAHADSGRADPEAVANSQQQHTAGQYLTVAPARHGQEGAGTLGAAAAAEGAGAARAAGSAAPFGSGLGQFRFFVRP